MGLARCWYILLLITSVQSACRFPEVMYTKSNSHFYILSKNPRVTDKHHFQKVEAKDNTVTLSAMKSEERKVIDIVSYECLEKQYNNKYIVKILKDGHHAKYTCLQIFERTKWVVQWKMGGPTASLDNVSCRDSLLTLWDAPIVNRERAQSMDTWYDEESMKIDYQICPLTGGYILEWYNTTKGRYECIRNKAIPPYKYEHNCILGEGVLFHALEGHADCPTPVTPGGYKVKTKYSCFAFWEDSSYQYMLLDSTNWPKSTPHQMPCVRVPKVRRNAFEIHFFGDGICDSTVEVINTHDYVKMRLTKYKVRSLCGNDSPGCVAAACDFYGVATCRRKCNTCQNGAYAEVDFREDLQGKWLKQMDRVNDDVIEITGSNLKFPSMGEFINIGNTSETCMKGLMSPYRKGFSDENNGYENAIEYLLILDPFRSDGCSLHAVTVSLVNRSQAVLSIKISQSSMQKALRDGNVSHPTLQGDSQAMCYNTHYKQDANPLSDTYHRNSNGWYNLVRIDPPPTTVPCDMPKINSEKVVLKLLSGLTCSGTLTKTDLGSLNFTFDECETAENNTDFQYSNRTAYTIKCLANFKVKTEDNSNMNFAIVQSSDLKPGLKRDHVCWVFADNHPDVISWYPVSMCDVNSLTDTQWDLRYRLPVANLTISSGQAATQSTLPVQLLLIVFTMISLG